MTGDGVTAQIAPGALTTETLVQVRELQESQLPMALPEWLQFVAAIDLEVGPTPLAQPVQLSLPAPHGLAPGTEVFIYSPGSMPGEDGTLQPIWLQEEVGIVGEDGEIRTTSPPHKGVLKSNTYALAAANVVFETGRLTVRVGSQIGGLAGGAAAGAVAAVGFAEQAVGVIVTFNLSTPYAIHLPRNTPLNYSVFQLTPAGPTLLDQGAYPPLTAAETTFTLTVTPVPTIPGAPVVQSVILEFDGTTPILVIEGTDFGDPTEGNLEVAFIENARAGRIDWGTLRAGSTDTRLFVEVPNKVTLGLSEIRVRKAYTTLDGEVRVLESNAGLIDPASRYSFVAESASGEVTVFTADRGDKALNGPVAMIPLPGKRPSAVAVSPDFTRTYVANRADRTLSVIDAFALQQVQVRPGIRADIPLPGTPFAIAMDPLGRYAFVTDANVNDIYVVDINPSSSTYHTVVRTLLAPQFSPHSGLTGAAVNRDGTALLVAAINRRSEADENAPGAGHVYVFDVRKADPATFSLVADLVVGDYPYGVAPTSDPDAMLVTNFLSDSKGVQIIRRKAGVWSVTKTIPLILGPSTDSFDVDNAREIVFVPSPAPGVPDYAFVVGYALPDPTASVIVEGFFPVAIGGGSASRRHGYRYISPHHAGSNIGVIRDPLGSNPQLVAATRPIPHGFPNGIALSADGHYLHVPYSGVGVDETSERGALFVYDTLALISEVEMNLLTNNRVALSPALGGGQVPILHRHPVNDVLHGVWTPATFAADGKLIGPPSANPAIDINAAYRVKPGSPDFFVEFESYLGNDYAPLGIGGNAKGVHIGDDLPLVNPEIVGIRDYFFTRNGESFELVLRNGRSRTDLVVEIKVDGPIQAFLTVGTLPPRLDDKFVLTSGQVKVLRWHVRDLEQAAYDVDQFFAAQFRITAHAKTRPDVPLLDEVFNVARFLSVLDPYGQTNNALFYKTIADGPGGFVREKMVEYHLPRSVDSRFLVNANQQEFTGFGVPLRGEGRTTWKFDPASLDPEEPDRIIPVAYEAGNRLLLVNGSAGLLSLRGTVSRPTMIGLNREGYLATFVPFFLGLEVGLTGLVVYSGNGVNSVLSYEFEQEFAEFMPSNREAGPDGLRGTNDDLILGTTTSFVTTLESRLNDVFGDLLEEVREDFGRVNRDGGVSAFSVTDGAGDKNVYWVLQFSKSAPPDADGRADIVADPQLAAIIKDPRVGRAAQEWALAQGLNVAPTQGTAEISIPRIASRGTFPASSYDVIKALKNLVVHEVAHTYGLPEGYEITGGTLRTLFPHDVMAAGPLIGRKDLGFGLHNTELLQASLGFHRNVDRPLREAYAFYIPRAGSVLHFDGFVQLDTLPEVLITLDGTPLPPNQIVDLPQSLAGEVVTVELVISNEGLLPLHIDSIQLGERSEGFTVVPGLEGSVVEAATAITLRLLFRAPEAGTFETSVTVLSDAGSYPAYLIPLRATAISIEGDVAIDPPANNNLGGQQIGAPAVLADEFATITNRGASPLSIFDVRVTEGADQFSVAGLPIGTNLADPLVLPPGGSITLDAAFAPLRIGLQRGTVQVVTDDPDTPIHTLTITGTGLPGAGSALATGNYYVGLRSITNGVLREQHTRSDASGRWKFTVPVGSTVAVTILDPISGLVVNDFGVATGTTYDQTQILSPFFPSIAHDSDGDGLPDDIEFAIGTALDRFDTNSDGIDDFESIKLGIDPLRAVFLRKLLLNGDDGPRTIQVASSTLGPTVVSGSETSGEYTTFGVRPFGESFGTVMEFEPSTQSAPAGAFASITSRELTNGDFHVSVPDLSDFGWTLHGAAGIENATGVLREDSRGISQFSQSFLIPAEARYLQFTLVASELHAYDDGPSDTFEVALLNAADGQSLVPTAAGQLAGTDALLNLQAGGQLFYGSSTQVQGAGGSGEVAQLTMPTVVTVDISAVAAGTIATLYFDLLGFGAVDGSVTIDDVRFLTAAAPTVQFQLDPASDSATVGDDLTNVSLVSLVGTTDPFLQVLLDLDGDGFDDGSATAGADGAFRFDHVPLAEGANSIRMQVNAEDQTMVAQRTIRLDTQPPSGALILPSPSAVLNAVAGYVEVQWTDAGVAGLDAASFGIDDVAITGVTVDSFEHLGDGGVRYTYSGALPEGTIQVQLVAGAVADRAGNTNAAASFSFVVDRLGPVGILVDPAPASTIGVDAGYVEIQWLDIGLAGLDHASFGITDVMVTGVSINRVQDLGGGLVRYSYDGQSLPDGTISVTLQAGAVRDRAGNANDQATASFTVATAAEPVDVTALVTVQYFGVQFNRRTGVWAFYGQVTNQSDQPLSAPIRVLWAGLAPAGSVAINADGTLDDGTPYFEIDAGDGVLEPGETSVTRTFAVKTPSSTQYSFTTRVTAVLPAGSAPAPGGNSASAAPPTVYPYHNYDHPLDVNGNGSLDPLDALIIVNRLNSVGPGLLAAPDTPPQVFPDVNADGALTPLDALLVINALNASLLTGEGESAAFPGSAMIRNAELGASETSPGGAGLFATATPTPPASSTPWHGPQEEAALREELLRAARPVVRDDQQDLGFWGETAGTSPGASSASVLDARFAHSSRPDDRLFALPASQLDAAIGLNDEELLTDLAHDMARDARARAT